MRLESCILVGEAWYPLFSSVSLTGYVFKRHTGWYRAVAFSGNIMSFLDTGCQVSVPRGDEAHAELGGWLGFKG